MKVSKRKIPKCFSCHLTDMQTKLHKITLKGIKPVLWACNLCDPQEKRTKFIKARKNYGI